MNAAARILCGLRKFDPTTNHMRDTLHWLQVPQRVKFKLCLLTYKALHGLAPNYLSELCTPVASVDSRNHMRSASSAGPRAWNSLPSNIKSDDSVSSYKRQLKTYLFAECYGHKQLTLFLSNRPWDSFLSTAIYKSSFLYVYCICICINILIINFHCLYFIETCNWLCMSLPI